MAREEPFLDLPNIHNQLSRCRRILYQLPCTYMRGDQSASPLMEPLSANKTKAVKGTKAKVENSTETTVLFRPPLREWSPPKNRRGIVLAFR